MLTQPNNPMPRSWSLLVLFVLVACLSTPTTAQDAPQGLLRFIPNVEDLPSGCQVRTLDDKAPPFLTSNPQASGDPTFIKNMVEMVFRGGVQSSNVEEALMGAYQSTHEVGLLAYFFNNNEEAKKARNVAVGNEEAQEILLKDASLVLIWRDGSTDTCFEAITNHVRTAMGL